MMERISQELFLEKKYFVTPLLLANYVIDAWKGSFIKQSSYPIISSKTNACLILRSVNSEADWGHLIFQFLFRYIRLSKNQI
jgi:hypothetical protein